MIKIVRNLEHLVCLVGLTTTQNWPKFLTVEFNVELSSGWWWWLDLGIRLIKHHYMMDVNCYCNKAESLYTFPRSEGKNYLTT